MKLSELHRNQPMATIKQVWQNDEHHGKDVSRWYTSGMQSTKPYHWPTEIFHGQSEGWSEHQLVK